MANLKKTKEIAINEVYGDTIEDYDEYRSFSKQVNDFINEIKDPTSPKHILANIDIPSSSLANHIILYTDRSSAYRCYLSNLRKGKSIKTPVILTYKSEFEASQNEAVQRVPEILKGPLINILEEWKYFVNFFLHFGPLFTSSPNPIIEYESLLFNINRHLTAIINNVKREKDYLLSKNCKTVCFEYTNEYIILCTYIIQAAIFFFIIFNPYVLKRKTLEELFEKLNFICDNLNENNKCATLQTVFKKLTIDAKLPFDMDLRVDTLTHNADLIYAHFAALNNIDDILVEELDKNTYTPFDSSIIKIIHEISNTSEIAGCIKNIMKEKNLKKKTLKQYLGNIQLFLSADELLYNHFANPKNIFQNLVAFQEIYLSDLKYKRRTAKCTVGKIAKGNEDFIKDLYNNPYHYTFIKRKMVRGTFTIRDMSDEYKIFIKIEKKCRELFFKPYHVIYDIGQMYFAYAITKCILDNLYEIVTNNIYQQRGLKNFSEY